MEIGNWKSRGTAEKFPLEIEVEVGKRCSRVPMFLQRKGSHDSKRKEELT